MKKILVVVGALLLLRHHSMSQNYKERIDSLLVEMSNATEDTIKLNLYVQLLGIYDYYQPEEGLRKKDEALQLAANIKSRIWLARIKDKIGRLYWRTGSFSKAYPYHFDALETYVVVGDKKAQINTLIWIGQDYINDNIYDKSSEYLLRALKLSEEIGDKSSMARAYDILTALYQVQGNTVEAGKTIYAHIKIAEEIGDKKGLAYAVASLASNFQMMGNNADALKYYRQSLQLSKEAGDKLAETYAYREIGDLYLGMQNYQQAEISYQEGFKVAEQMENKWIVLAVLQRGIGNVYRLWGRYSEALHYLQPAANYLQSISSDHALATTYSEIGMVYTQLKLFDRAKASFDSAIALCKKLETPVPMGNYYNGVQLLDSATGNWKDAYNHYKEFVAIKDSSFNKETLKKMVATQLQYEQEKKEAIAKVEQEKKDVQAREELKRQRVLRNWAIVVLAGVLLFSMIVYRQRNKLAIEKKRSDQLLSDKELLLREIHHRVKNNLELVSSLLALQSAQIKDPGAREVMQEGQNRVHSIGIVHQKLYQGEKLGTIEMKEYFGNLGESILNSFGAEDRVQIDLAMEHLNVDIDTAVPLGLIVNELLTNALKYAFPNQQSGAVRIKLERKEEGRFHLEVSDNGVGKTGTVKGTGFGGQLVSLLTMQLNGSMQEVNNNGTAIYFDFKPEKAA